MFKLTISVSAPDFEHTEIEVDCPHCRLHTPVQLGEVRRRDIVICRGCHANIRLEDHIGQLHRFLRYMQDFVNRWS